MKTEEAKISIRKFSNSPCDKQFHHHFLLDVETIVYEVKKDFDENYSDTLP